MASPQTRRTGQETYNGFDINLYGFLPSHLILKDYESASLGIADFWDPTNGRQELIGASGLTAYTYTTVDTPNALTIAVFSGAQILADDGSGVLKDQGGVSRGSVNYTTGAVIIAFATAAEYPVYITYSTGSGAPAWDANGEVWDRLAEAPVIQKTFWAIELDAMELVETIDNLGDLAFVDTIESPNTQYKFNEWGFDGQILELDIAKSRQWLREMASMWRLKNSYRMWNRLLQNLGFDAEVHLLYKKHPLNNYGENSGESYSRTLNKLTIAQQKIYEKAIHANGDSPVGVASPVAGEAFSGNVGLGDNSSIVSLQFNLTEYPPDWTTLNLYGYTAGVLENWTITVNSTTGYIEVYTGSIVPIGLGKGLLDLTTGTGYIDFTKEITDPVIHIPATTIITSDTKILATYTQIGTPYQAARVDLTVDLGDTPGYNAGDRGATAVERVIEYVRPIHVIVRQFEYRQTVDEDARFAEGGCCGPNVVRSVEHDYPEYTRTEAAPDVLGLQVYGGNVSDAPIARGQFSIADSVSGQTGTADYWGNIYDANGVLIGFVDYNLGKYQVQFGIVTGAIPVITYKHLDATAVAQQLDVQSLGDGSDIGESQFDRSDVNTSIEYSDADVDADFENIMVDAQTVTPTTDSVVGSATQFKFQGTATAIPVIPGTVTVLVAGTGETMADNGHGELYGNGGIGSIDYNTGAWFIAFHPSVLRAITFDLGYDAISAGATRFAGTLDHTNIVSESIKITDTSGQIAVGNALGKFTGDVDAGGTNTINYATGAYDVTFAAKSGIEVYAVYAFASAGSHTVDEDVAFTTEDHMQMEADSLSMQILDIDYAHGRTPYDLVTTPGSASYSGTIPLTENYDRGTCEFTDGVLSLVDTTSVDTTFIGDGSGTLDYASGAYTLLFNSPTVSNPRIGYSYYDGEGFVIRDFVELTLGFQSYSGTLNSDVVPGSVRVVDSVGGYTLTDLGEVTLTGDGTGTFNYITGDFDLTFSGITVASVLFYCDAISQEDY